MATGEGSPACAGIGPLGAPARKQRAGFPRLDLLDWYERQLTKLQVVMRLNTPMDPDEVEGFDADVVVLATGSQPAGTGWQRGFPTVDRLPGIDRPGVFSV